MRPQSALALKGASVEEWADVHFFRPVGIRIARKHLGWYSKGLYGSSEFRAAVNRVDDPETVKTMIRDFFAPLVAEAA